MKAEGYLAGGDDGRASVAERARAAAVRLLAGEVRARRTALGLSVEELGERAAFGDGVLAQIENAERGPDLLELLDLAEALDMDPGELLRSAGARSPGLSERGSRERARPALRSHGGVCAAVRGRHGPAGHGGGQAPGRPGPRSWAPPGRLRPWLARAPTPPWPRSRRAGRGERRRYA
jgi:transcriptional regulator with XRE-family HTH domain